MAHCDAESYERCSSHHPCVRLEPIRRTGGIHAALHFCGDTPRLPSAKVWSFEDGVNYQVFDRLRGRDPEI